MNNNKLAVLAAFIVVCVCVGKSGNGSQKLAIAMSNMPLVLAMELCLHVRICCTWSGFTGTISTRSCAERKRGSLECQAEKLT